MRNGFFYILSLLLMLAGTPGQTQELQTVLDKLHTLRAEFNQQLFDQAGKRIEESRGIFYLQRPNRFRWEYFEPYQQLIVADGELIWIYDADLEQATLKDYNQATANTPAIVLSGLQPVTELFTVSIESEDNGVTAYRLQSNHKDAQFEKMWLYFQGDILQRMRLQDSLAQTTDVHFSGVQVNVSVDAEQFQFTPPLDTDIIDGRE